MVDIWNKISYIVCMKTQDARSLSPDAQEAIRMKAAKAVQDGTPISTVSRMFGVSREAIYQWKRAKEAGGAAALQGKQRGRPVGGTLSQKQQRAIAKKITDKHPEQLKLPFYLWTREAIVLLIARKYGITLSVWTIGRYLKRWGFTPQKPVRQAFEKDQQKVDQWLKTDYPAIARRAKREKAEIFWGDEMGLRSDYATGRTYAPRGQTPVVAGTGQRFGCNMISVLTNKGRLHFMVFHRSFTLSVFLKFLKRLVRQVDHKIYLIVDSHPVHRSKIISAWMEKNKETISIFFLPAYSPELNPDELVNQDVKNNALGRRRAYNRTELMANVRGYLRR